MGSNNSHLSSLRLKLDITEHDEKSKQTQYFRACGSTTADPLLDEFYSSFSEANMETVYRVVFWTLIFCHHTRSLEGKKAINYNYISTDIYTHFL